LKEAQQWEQKELAQPEEGELGQLAGEEPGQQNEREQQMEQGMG